VDWLTPTLPECSRSVSARRSEEVNKAQSRYFQLWVALGRCYVTVIALVVVLVAQLLLSAFGVYTPNWLEIGISGLGVFLFVGASVVDFYILPRTYRNDQYLPAALSMYLTYINLFVFILRLLIALNSRD
jgi:FtsH-binding integral membrane protein